MANEVFRKKSLERIETPDDMRKILRISSPRLWMVLLTILALLVGFIIYASVASIENVIPVKAEVTYFSELDEPVSVIIAELPLDMSDTIDIGMECRIEGQNGLVEAVAEMGDKITVSIVLDDPSVMLKNGTYDAEIVLERISPIRFLLK